MCACARNGNRNCSTEQLNKQFKKSKKIKMAKASIGESRYGMAHRVSRMQQQINPFRKRAGARMLLHRLWSGRSANEIYWIGLEFCSEIVVWDFAVFRLFVCLFMLWNVHCSSHWTVAVAYLHRIGNGSHCIEHEHERRHSQWQTEAQMLNRRYVYWILCDAMATTTIATTTATTTQI